MAKDYIKYVYFNVIEEDEADGPFETIEEAKERAEEYNQPDSVALYKAILIDETVPKPDKLIWKY